MLLGRDGRDCIAMNADGGKHILRKYLYRGPYNSMHASCRERRCLKIINYARIVTTKIPNPQSRIGVCVHSTTCLPQVYISSHHYIIQDIHTHSPTQIRNAKEIR